MSSPRTRVLITVPHVSPTASPYREMMAIATHLSRADFELSVCSLRDGGFAETKPLLEALGVHCFVAPFRPRRHSPRFWMESLAAQRAIARHGPFDIQHSFDFTSSPFEAAMARMAGRRYVYSQRNLNEQGHLGWLRVKVRLSHGVVAVAEHLAGFVRDLGAPPSKIRTVFNGIALDELDRELNSCPPTPREGVLMVGHLVPLKRYEDAIQAFHLIASRFPELRLEIVGQFYDTAYSNHLSLLVRQLGLEHRVLFYGSLPNALMLMRDSRALLLCSRSEGLPWVLLEAMAAGVPVIASDIPANREIIEDGRNGFLVPVGDQAAYAERLSRVLISPDRNAPLVRAARLCVEAKFSASTMVRALEDFYLHLLHRPRLNNAKSLTASLGRN